MDRRAFSYALSPALELALGPDIVPATVDGGLTPDTVDEDELDRLGDRVNFDLAIWAVAGKGRLELVR